MTDNTVYIFGNGNLGFDTFIDKYVPVLDKCLEEGFHFMVCDFRGADTMTLEYLKDKTHKVTLVHCFEKPRYCPDKHKTKVSNWKVEGGFTSDSNRDNFCIESCSHYFAIDLNSNDKRTSGTLTNLNVLESLNKISF